MRVGVKYCGGCNPRYDRVDFVARLKAGLGSGVEWSYAGALAEAPDFLLVVCGCTAACADHRNLTAVHGKRVVFAQDQYAAALEQLSRLKAGLPAAEPEPARES